MSNLRWSNEVNAVVDENDTIAYVVSAEAGAMIVGYQQATALAEQRHQLLGQRNTQIGVLQTRVAAMQDTINQQRAELAEASELLEQAEKRITELEQCFDSERQRHHETGARIPVLMARIAELEAQLSATLRTIESAAWCDRCNLPADHCRENHDGRVYAEECAP